jgi:hypothetical protein
MNERHAAINEARRNHTTQANQPKTMISKVINFLSEKFDSFVITFYKYTS